VLATWYIFCRMVIEKCQLKAHNCCFTGCQPGHPRSTSEGLWNYVILWYGKDLKKSDFRAPFEPFAAVQVAQIAALLIVVAIQCMLAQQPAGVLRDQLSSRVSIVGEPV
jgi:hypothetical protein